MKRSRHPFSLVRCGLLKNNIVAQTIYLWLKRVIFFVLRRTRLVPIADIHFRLPLKALLHPKKMLLFAVVKQYSTAIYPAMDNAYHCALAVKKRGIPGAFVEFGNRADSVNAVMAFVDKTRKTWYIKLFEGVGEINGSIRELIYSLDLPAESHRFVEGKREEALRKYKKEVEAISVLRLNSSLYHSTKTALEELYDLVAPMGYIIVADYGGSFGCHEAVDDFFKERKVRPMVYRADLTEYVFIKMATSRQ